MMNKIAKIEMLNTKQAAAILGVSSKTIYRMEERGLIQSIRTPGGQRRFRREDLEKYLNASKSFIAPQNPSKYKNAVLPSSFVKEKTVEYPLFETSETDISLSVARLQQQMSIRNIGGHKQHYDTGANIYRWIDEWDFKSYQTKTYTHGFHTYPAMFIPQVARKLIEVFSSEHDTVCDIFCGSGTTMVESSLLNRNSIGIELNPLAVLIGENWVYSSRYSF